MSAKNTLSFFFILSTYFSFSQDYFQEGYYISSENKKVNCLIQNDDWRRNPSGITVKENDVERTLNLEDINEFSINGYSKYVKFVVQIDQSSTNYSNLSTERDPIWKTDTILLKTILDSRISLLEYYDGAATKYFISENGKAQQLVYKKYQREEGIALVNKKYQQQIKGYANCNNITNADAAKIQYRKKDLIEAFRIINTCLDSEIINYFELGKGSKDSFNFRITSGVSFNSLSIQPLNGGDEINYDDKTNVRFGLEFEYPLPFKNGAWTLVAEANYQYYKADGDPLTRITGGTVERVIDYQSLVIPIGVRRYVPLGSYKMFINAFYSLDFDFGSETGITGVPVDSNPALAFGAGIQKNKLGFESRYYLSRNITARRSIFSSRFEKLSLIVAYQLF